MKTDSSLGQTPEDPKRNTSGFNAEVGLDFALDMFRNHQQVGKDSHGGSPCRVEDAAGEGGGT